jgi:hypothetical protein
MDLKPHSKDSVTSLDSIHKILHLRYIHIYHSKGFLSNVFFSFKLKFFFVAYLKHNKFFCVLGTPVVRSSCRFPSSKTHKIILPSEVLTMFKKISKRQEGVFRNKKKKIYVRHTAE